MDFHFDEEERMLMVSAKKFLEKEAPARVVRALYEDEKGYSPEMWEKMGQLGWMGLPFSQDYGGYDGPFLQLGVIQEALGAAAVPTPFFTTVVVSGLLLQDWASPEIKEEYLPHIAAGDSIVTLALAGKSGLYGWDHTGLVAEAFPGGYRLEGSAYYVPYAHVADHFICAAKTPSETGEGVTLFLVGRHSQGVDTVPLKTVTGLGTECVVRCQEVEVPPDRVVGEVGKGWQYIKAVWPQIAAALSCECVGGMDKVLDLCFGHVNQRIQFGRPLSAFQVVQHMCVDMFAKAETARHAAHYAAWMLSEGMACRKEASIAKAWCGEAFKDVTKMAHQVTGGIGFTEEFDLHLYTRNAKRLEVSFGNGDYHRGIVADALDL